MKNKNYERTKYEELKRSFLFAGFSACVSKFHNGKVDSWGDNESEWGYASYHFEGCFSLPIEQLMLNVIEIITEAGRSVTTHEICLQEINDILSKYTPDELFADLDDEEKEDFLYDLELVLNNQVLSKNIE